MSRIGLLAHESQRVEQLTSTLDRTLMIEQAPPDSRLAERIPGYDPVEARSKLADVIESLARLVDPHVVPKPIGPLEPVPGGLIGRIRSEQRHGRFPTAQEMLEVVERLRDGEQGLRPSDVTVLKLLSGVARAEATQLERLQAQ